MAPPYGPLPASESVPRAKPPPVLDVHNLADQQQASAGRLHERVNRVGVAGAGRSHGIANVAGH